MGKFKKQLKALKKSYKLELEKSWQRGYDYGIEFNQSGSYIDGFNDGVAAQKEATRNRLKASEELALSAGRGAEAVRMREMAEFLDWEYDPEKAMEDYIKADGEY